MSNISEDKDFELDSNRIRRHFPLINNRNIAYLDNGATTQKPMQVLEAMNNYYENNTLYNDIGVETDDKAEIKVTNLFIGGNVYQGCRVTLSGKESKVEKSIGYFLDGNDKLDMNYVVDHIAPRTECDIDAQGVLEGTSEKVFRGTIDFKNGCAGAVGGEIESVLMRSDDVVCQSIPVILCSEEDVAGNHGASIGKLDEDLLFYMSC